MLIHVAQQLDAGANTELQKTPARFLHLQKGQSEEHHQCNRLCLEVADAAISRHEKETASSCQQIGTSALCEPQSTVITDDVQRAGKRPMEARGLNRNI